MMYLDYLAEFGDMETEEFLDRKVGFGKHREATYRQVLETDPSYIIWLKEKTENFVDVPDAVCNAAYIAVDSADRYDNDWRDGHPSDFGDR